MIPRAKRRDPNEADIVKALRSVGASVTSMHEPCDLLVGYRGTNYLIEVKSPPGPRGGRSSSGQRLNPRQQQWHDGWRGQVAIVTTVMEALDVIGAPVIDTREL